MKRIIFNENVSVTFIEVSISRKMVIFYETGRVPGGVLVPPGKTKKMEFQPLRISN